MLRTPAVLMLLVSLACSPGPEPASGAGSAPPAAWATDRDSAFFLQMADTQFGAWATPLLFAYMGWNWKPDSFERETDTMEQAIAHANRLEPDFVVICGDLVNTVGHEGQISEFERIAGRLDPSIPLHLVAGNHDVGNVPTPDTLAGYRGRFGPDWYGFRHGDVHGIVLNSQLIHSPHGAPAEAERQLQWLAGELARARESGAAQVLVFQHHPFFLESPEESDAYFNIPRERRQRYLALFREAGVRAIFSGHYHRNAHGWDGPLEMVTTSAVGMPLGDDPSGFRIVRVGPAGLDHAYFPLDAMPSRLGAENSAPRPQDSTLGTAAPL